MPYRTPGAAEQIYYIIKYVVKERLLMKKIKCKVCGKRFEALKVNRYEANESKSLVDSFTKPTRTIECFDCPRCGCQQMVNIRENRKVQAEEETENENQSDSTDM